MGNPHNQVVVWLNRGMEALWLLSVLLVPLAFYPRDFLLSELELAYVDVPKTALLRTLVGLMAILWLLEWGLQGRVAGGSDAGEKGRGLTTGRWLRGTRDWLGGQSTRWLILAVILYLASTLLSTALSASFSVSMWGLVPGQDTYPAYTIVAYVVLFGVIATHLKTSAQLNRLLGAIVIMGVLVGAYSVAQYYGHDVFNLRENPVTNRSGSTMGNAILAGAVLLMSITISLSAATITLKESLGTGRQWCKVGLWTLVLAVQMLGMVITFSRGPWIGTLAALLAFLGLVATLVGWRAFGRAALVLGLAGGLTAIIIQVPPPIPTGHEVSPPAETLRLAPTTVKVLGSVGREVGGGGLSGRLDIWRTSWRIIQHHPWVEFDSLNLSFLRSLIGYGPDLFKYTYLMERRPFGEEGLLVSNRFAHNFLVHNTVELGFLGLITSLGVFVALFAVGGYQLLRQRRSYSDLHKLLLVTVLATVVGRIVEQSVGVAAVSDLAISWALLAVFVALPAALGLREGRRGSDSHLSRRQRPSLSRSKPRSSAYGAQLAWRLALAACLMTGVGVLTWEKSINYPWAAVEARRGLDQLYADNYPGALGALSHAIALAPDVSVYHNLRAATYSAYRHNDNKPREPECAVEAPSTSYQICLARKVYLSNREGAKQRPLDWRSRLAQAEAALTLASLEGDADLANEAIRLYREVAELDPHAWWHWEYLAAAQIRIGQPEAALSPLEKALALAPDPERLAHVLMFRGIAYRELGHLDLALREFSEAISQDPRLTDLYINRGATYNDLGQFQQAIQDLDQAIQLSPERAMAYNNRGNSYGNLDQFERAIEDYGEAIRLEPRLGLAYYNRALAYTYLRRDAEAQQDVRRATELGLDPAPLLAKIKEITKDR